MKSSGNTEGFKAGTTTVTNAIVLFRACRRRALCIFLVTGVIGGFVADVLAFPAHCLFQVISWAFLSLDPSFQVTLWTSSDRFFLFTKMSSRGPTRLPIFWYLYSYQQVEQPILRDHIAQGCADC